MSCKGLISRGEIAVWSAQMTDVPRSCDPHPDLTTFQYELLHLRQKLLSGQTSKIVAIGSSSTAGEGNITPYPPRLELALRRRYPGRVINVLNKGIGDQEAPE